MKRDVHMLTKFGYFLLDGMAWKRSTPRTHNNEYHFYAF
jgi:hypothetical protein